MDRTAHEIDLLLTMILRRYKIVTSHDCHSEQGMSMNKVEVRSVTDQEV